MSDPRDDDTLENFGDLPIQPTGSGVADMEIAYEQMRVAAGDGGVADAVAVVPTETGGRCGRQRSAPELSGMAETIISPSGPGAIEAGLMIDETGTRFVVLTFKEPGADPVLVTFTVPIFRNFYAHLGRTADAADDERNWDVSG